MKYYCDTNFVIRYLIKDNEEVFIKTKEMFEKAKTGKIFLILEQAVFAEIVFVLSSFYKVHKTKIAEILSELLAYKGIACEDKDSLISALGIYAKENLHIVDCLLAAKSMDSGTEILSFDERLLNFRKKRTKV